MRRKLLSILTILWTQLAAAQPVTTQMQAGRTPDGVVYFLPKTVFHINILVEKTTFTPGEFALYAEKYLRRSDVQQEAETTHQVIDISITSTGVRDTSKCYSTRLKGGKCETADIKLSDDGVLLAINDTPPIPHVHKPFKASPQGVKENARRYLNSDILTAGSMAKMAELTAWQMQKLQEYRQDLITADADEQPQDERQLNRMLSEIDQEYDALLSLFTGTYRRDTVERTITLCPEKEIRHEVLFRLSKQLGLVDKDDLSGVPYYITITDPNKTDQAKYPIPVNKKNEGFYVNVPGSIMMTLEREELPLATFRLSAAQFGFVELRDGTLFRRYVPHMTLHPATGAVERIYF